ncbi:MAG: S16 family serine protease, partial [Pseudomonadota bacterium]
IKKVLIPEDNAKDLAEIPDNVKSGLEIVPVSTVDEVLKHALTKKLKPIRWDEKKERAAEAARQASIAADDGSNVTAH